jgi:uncharacterized protein YkwD
MSTYNIARRYGSVVVAATLLLLPSITAAAAGLDANGLSRAEAAVLLLQTRTKNLPAIANVGQFKDIPASSRYETSLLAAERFGILSASNGFLQPDTPVSRAGFLKMVVLTFGLTTHTSFSYTDVPASSWAAPFVGLASRYDLFSDKSDSSLLPPDTPITLLEAKKVVQTLIDDKAIVSPQAQKVSSDQADYGLTIYEKISTEQDEILHVDASPAPSNGTATPLQNRPAMNIIKDQIIALTNNERVTRNLPPLHPDVLLASSAQHYAELMLAKGFFGHVSPNGQTLKNRMENSGYYNPAYQLQCLCIQKFMVGENIARGQKTAQEVMSDWMKSPSHREAILNPDFTDIGVGVAAGIWVQHFGGVRYLNGQ